MDEIDHIELEVKIACDDTSAVEARLRSLGAEFIGCWSETDMFFDFEDNKLKRNDSALRLRARDDVNEGHTSYRLTFKGRRQDNAYKCRREIELAIESPDVIQSLLEALGLKPFIAYTKKRNSWRYGNCTIEVDNITDIGNFIEIEGPDKETIDNVLKDLNLAGEPAITKSYLEMIMEYQSRQK